MCSGLGRPLGSVGGTNRRGKSSRIERAAEIAARSAARWTRPLPVTAPPIAASASVASISTATAPNSAGNAWPDSSRSSRAQRAIRREAPPPGSIPAIARRAATRPSARPATLTRSPAPRRSRTASAASERSRGSSARSSTPVAPSQGSCTSWASSPAGRCTTAALCEGSVAISAERRSSESSPGSARQQTWPRAATLHSSSSSRSDRSSRAASGDDRTDGRGGRAAGSRSQSKTGRCTPEPLPRAAATASAAARAAEPPASPRPATTSTCDNSTSLIAPSTPPAPSWVLPKPTRKRRAAGPAPGSATAAAARP